MMLILKLRIDTVQRGELLSRLTNDVDNVTNTVCMLK